MERLDVPDSAVRQQFPDLYAHCLVFY
jgi:hypothetical protein